MKREKNKNNSSVSLSLLLVIANGLVAFLAPMASSKFKGSISGTTAIINFHVDVFGKWFESYSYSGWGDGSSSGDASDIGTYFPTIIPLISIGLAFCFIGMMFLWPRFDWGKSKKASDVKLRNAKIYRLIGITTSTIGGLLGLIAYILFGIFTSSIIQPHQNFPATNFPKVHPSVGYFFCLLCFVFYIYSGIYRGIDFKNIIKKELIEIRRQEENDKVKHSVKKVNEHTRKDKQNIYQIIAKRMVFDKEMKTQMEIMITDIKSQISEEDIPKIFQEVLTLLANTKNKTNDIKTIGQTFEQIGAKEFINQLKDIKSQLKDLYMVHSARKIIDIIEGK